MVEQLAHRFDHALNMSTWQDYIAANEKNLIQRLADAVASKSQLSSETRTAPLVR